MRETARGLIDWAARWGFGFLVVCGAISAGWIGLSVDLPSEIPSFALQAAPVYRLEVAAAVFASIYLGSMSLALALNGRAFSDIGTGGVKAQDIRSAAEDRAIADHERRLSALTRVVETLAADRRPDDPRQRYTEADDN